MPKWEENLKLEYGTWKILFRQNIWKWFNERYQMRWHKQVVDLSQEWAISGSRATCGPPQRFQWHAEAIRKNH